MLTVATATIHTPGCAGAESEWLATTDRNRRISRQIFRYLRCDRCDLVRLANVPADLSRYYPNEYYELPALHRLTNIADADTSKIDLVRRFADRGRLLEIGPAHGVFAFQARRAGFDVDVIEMDRRCCDHLRDVVGVNTICSDAPQEALRGIGPYDVMALWHVIEHVPDPWALLDAAAAALATGGVLVIAAPNPASWQLGVMRSEWPHIDAPRHLYLLPIPVLKRYLERCGLRLVHSTSSDADARRWNRFGWQRLLMNRLPGRWGQRAGFIAGLGLGAVMARFETRDRNGSAYTLVFQRA